MGHDDVDDDEVEALHGEQRKGLAGIRRDDRRVACGAEHIPERREQDEIVVDQEDLRRLGHLRRAFPALRLCPHARTPYQTRPINCGIISWILFF